MDSDDAVLIERCRGGDLAAFEPLVEKYRQRVYRLAYNILRDPEEAWDVAQGQISGFGPRSYLLGLDAVLGLQARRSAK